jgi:hypothetical protein
MFLGTKVIWISGSGHQAIRPSGPAKTTIIIHDMLGYPKLARFLVVGHGA